MIRLSRTILLALATVTVACSTAPPSFGGSRARTSEFDVYETAIRWIHANYRAGETRGYPAAWCLATGRRAATAFDRYRRGADELWSPPRRLMDRLTEIRPPVVPIGECHRNGEQEEEWGEGGPSAAVLVIEQPIWQSATQATLRMRTRETNFYAFSYNCRIEQRNVVWRILECV